MKKLTMWLAALALGIGGMSFPARADIEVCEIVETDIFVIRYEALGELLEKGNFSLRQTEQTINDAKAPYQEALDVLNAEKRLMEENAEVYEDEGNDAMQQFYESQADQLKNAAAQMKTQLNHASSHSMERSYEKQRDALTMAAQTIFSSYKQLASTLAAQEKSLEAVGASYQAAVRKGENGLMKAEEVSQAKNTWQSLKNVVTSLEEQAERLKKSLLTMLGLEDMENAVIGEMPLFDQTKIDAIDLEHDMEVAVSYDSTYLNEKRSKVKGSENRELKEQRTADAAAEAKMSLTATYQKLCQKQLLYEGSRSEFEAAYQDYQALLRKKQSGLISQIQFLQGEAEYLTKKAECGNASAELYQAYENYCWEIKGIK